MDRLESRKFTFSGHESFPCKSLWLKKGYDFIKSGKDFNADNAVVDLGVGKNMVSAIRYWVRAFGLSSNKETGWIADYLFDSHKGRDCFMEDLGTLWLLHFLLVYSEEASLYKLFFVDFQKERRQFDRNQISSFIKRKMTEAGKFTLYNENTVKKDIGVLLQNYCLPHKPQSNEDYSTLLMDLDLLRQKEDGREYYFNIDGKRRVTPEIFLFALLMTMDDADMSASYDVLQELGLVFCMTDLEVIDLLKLLAERYSKSVVYSDVAGIRQLQFVVKMDSKEVLDSYYDAND